MTVWNEYVGRPFRQKTPELRFNGRTSVRPFDEQRKVFLDLDNPTIVRFTADDDVDVEALLRGRAIERFVEQPVADETTAEIETRPHRTRTTTTSKEGG